MRFFKAFILIIFFYVAIVFAFQNQSEVNLRFIFPWENLHWFGIQGNSLPIFLVICCSLFLGFLIGGLGDFYKRFQLKKMLRQHRKTIEKLEQEVQAFHGADFINPSLPRKEG